MEGEGGDQDRDWKAPISDSDSDEEPKKNGFLDRILRRRNPTQAEGSAGSAGSGSEDYVRKLFDRQIGSADARLELADLEHKLKVWERSMPGEPLPDNLRAVKDELRRRGMR